LKKHVLSLADGFDSGDLLPRRILLLSRYASSSSLRAALPVPKHLSHIVGQVGFSAVVFSYPSFLSPQAERDGKTTGRKALANVLAA
jgi:hypothetical protein